MIPRASACTDLAVQARVDDQSPDTLISGHLAFQNEKAPDLHFWTIAGAVQFGLAHKI